jgi:hypothetical protein
MRRRGAVPLLGGVLRMVWGRVPGDGVFLRQPGAEVDETAALAAERAEG